MVSEHSGRLCTLCQGLGYTNLSPINLLKDSQCEPTKQPSKHGKLVPRCRVGIVLTLSSISMQLPPAPRTHGADLDSPVLEFR